MVNFTVLAGTVALSTSVIALPTQLKKIDSTFNHNNKYISVASVSQTYNGNIQLIDSFYANKEVNDAIAIPVAGTIPVVLNGTRKINLNWF
jgi:hypothetical protein